MTYADFFPFPLTAAAAIPMSLMIGVLGLGVGTAFYISEPRSPATRALACSSVLTGVVVTLYFPAYVMRAKGWLFEWFVYIPLLEVGIMASLFAWIFYETRVAQPTLRALRLIKACGWLFAATTVVYLVLGARYQDLRMNEFIGCLGLPQGCATAGFRLFSLPIGGLTFFLVASMLILFLQRIDAAERVRAISVAVAAPFFFATYILPLGYGLFSTLMGYLVSVIGLLHYHRMQGERGVFMSRFLSPEVVKLVRAQGLAQTMQPQKLELTAICCDLRGFTHFSLEHDSDQVARLLGEYYKAVGAVVAEFGATIKDYVGDGVLILVGAPLPVAGHAAAGLQLARRVHAVASEITRRWASASAPLGVGVGVASGPVTVGAIDSASQLEYTAVGPAINLASHLCGQARGDEAILVDTRTAELAGSGDLALRQPVSVKGMGEVPHYALSTA